MHPILIFLLIFSSCTRNDNNFKIEGIVNGIKNTPIFLFQRSLSGTLPVDSAVISEKGTFVLRGYTERPNFYILFMHKDQYINLLIHPGDKFRILTTAEKFNRDYFVEGSKDSRQILNLVTKQAQTLDRITELSIEYENSLDRPDFLEIKTRLDSLYDVIFLEHKQYSINFIQENNESLVSLMALYQQLGRQSSVFDYKKDYKYFAQVDSALCIKYPGSEAVKDLNKKVTQIRDMLKVEIGAPAPPLVLPDTMGKPVALGDLKGKLVLLAFWASWSDASLAENTFLSNLYPKYHSKGFEVYQVSLDRRRESWIKAVQHEKSSWVHVSDLTYWDSPAVKLYRVESLPANFLIDSNGIIIAKNIMGRDLEQKLTEILP